MQEFAPSPLFLHVQGIFSPGNATLEKQGAAIPGCQGLFFSPWARTGHGGSLSSVFCSRGYLGLWFYTENDSRKENPPCTCCFQEAPAERPGWATSDGSGAGFSDGTSWDSSRSLQGSELDPSVGIGSFRNCEQRDSLAASPSHQCSGKIHQELGKSGDGGREGWCGSVQLGGGSATGMAPWEWLHGNGSTGMAPREWLHGSGSMGMAP